MDTVFDRVVIAVPDLQQATDACARLLGATPEVVATIDAPRAWLALHNTALELVERDVDRGVVEGLVFATATAPAEDAPVSNSLGLALGACDGSRTRAFRESGGAAADVGVDHVVLRTDAAEDCIALFTGQLGIRLALDRTVPQWGGRMLFFRGGKLTLEVIDSGTGDAGGSYFWGVAYQCADIDAFCEGLALRGVERSGVRDGRKPGTRVATVKSDCLDIPTLLIEPAT